MKKILKIFLVFAFLFCLFSINSYAKDQDGYVVKYKNSLKVKMISEEEKQKMDNTYSLYAQDDNIEWIVPNVKYELYSQDINWSYDMINASGANKYNSNGQGVKIAVIDSGVNPDEYMKDCVMTGINVFDETSDVTDNLYHGTFVTSLICSKLNDTHVQGISKDARIVPIKCFEKDKDTYLYHILNAIYYAVEVFNVDVINMSLGAPTYVEQLEYYTSYAVDHGIIVVSAVGNNYTSSLSYPSAHRGVIGVGSVNKNKEHSSFSQYNSSVDVVAPGEDVFGYQYGTYDNNSGTSFSCPMVTAAAAISLSIYPDLTPSGFENLLKETSEDLGAKGRDDYYGYGLLNIGAMCDKEVSDRDFFISPFYTKDSKECVDVINNTTNKQNFVLIFAKYTNGAVSSVYTKEYTIEKGETLTLNDFDISKDTKCFMLRSVSDITPLYSYRIY